MLSSNMPIAPGGAKASLNGTGFANSVIDVGPASNLGELSMAKKKAAKKTSAKRELISPRGDKRYVRRDSDGQFKESDDVGRSLSQDRKKKAKRVAKSGQGDTGDRKGK
jgi:hypothetical protein